MGYIPPPLPIIPQPSITCYIDSIYGNDANDGLSPATAMKSLIAPMRAYPDDGERLLKVRMVSGNRRQVQPAHACSYCGQSARPDWLYCGQGETGGCGAPLAQQAKEPDGVVSITRPGISAREFTDVLKRAVAATL